MGPLDFKTQQKPGAGSYPFTNGMRGGPISPLIPCCRAFKICLWAAFGTTVTGCRPTRERKILKTSFSLLTSQFTCSKSTKITVRLHQLLRIHELKYSHTAWVPWKFKSWYGLTLAFKTFKSIANNYHTLKSQVKYFVDLKYIYFWHETFLIAGKISLQFLAIEYFEFRSWL